MTAEAFAELVRQMRAAQKRYFAERTQSNITEAKRLEKQVDARLAEMSAKWSATQEDLGL